MQPSASPAHFYLPSCINIPKSTAHIYNGILLSHKKKWNWVICSDLDGPRACHTEWSKSEREKQILYANTYIQDLKKNGYDEPKGRTGIKTQT